MNPIYYLVVNQNQNNFVSPAYSIPTTTSEAIYTEKVERCSDLEIPTRNVARQCGISRASSDNILSLMFELTKIKGRFKKINKW